MVYICFPAFLCQNYLSQSVSFAALLNFLLGLYVGSATMVVLRQARGISLISM